MSIEANNSQWEQAPDVAKLPHDKRMDGVMARRSDPVRKEIRNIRALVDELQLICQRMGETADRMEERLGQ